MPWQALKRRHKGQRLYLSSIQPKVANTIILWWFSSAASVPAVREEPTITSSVEHFDLKTQAAAPLTFSFPITPTCSFNTTVPGDARATALVTIMNGSIAVWGATLMQLSPTATLTYDLKVGVDTVKAGTTFTLTIPTTSQMGSLVATTTIASPTNPQGIQFQAAIANWPLVSTL